MTIITVRDSGLRKPKQAKLCEAPETTERFCNKRHHSKPEAILHAVSFVVSCNPLFVLVLQNLNGIVSWPWKSEATVAPKNASFDNINCFMRRWVCRFAMLSSSLSGLQFLEATEKHRLLKHSDFSLFFLVFLFQLCFCGHHGSLQFRCRVPIATLSIILVALLISYPSFPAHSKFAIRLGIAFHYW